jgi:hypothetical protein
MPDPMDEDIPTMEPEELLAFSNAIWHLENRTLPDLVADDEDSALNVEENGIRWSLNFLTDCRYRPGRSRRASIQGQLSLLRE